MLLAARDTNLSQCFLEAYLNFPNEKCRSTCGALLRTVSFLRLAFDERQQGHIELTLPINLVQGAKAQLYFQRFAARLKPYPDTKQRLMQGFQQL